MEEKMGRLSERLDELERRMDELEIEVLNRPRSGRPATRLAEAKEWLSDILDTPTKFAVIRKIGKSKGFSMITLRRAAEDIGIVRHKGHWSFPARMTRNNYLRTAVLEAVDRPRKASEVIDEIKLRFPQANQAEIRQWAKRMGMDRGLLWYPFSNDQPENRKVMTDRALCKWFKEALPISDVDLEEHLNGFHISKHQFRRATASVDYRNIFDHYVDPDYTDEQYEKLLTGWIRNRLANNIGATGETVSVLRAQLIKEAAYKGAEKKGHIIECAKKLGIDTSKVRWKLPD